MRAYVIQIPTTQSRASVRKLLQSHESVGNEFDIFTWRGVTPDDVDERIKKLGIKWDFPDEGEEERDGLVLRAYKTKNKKARISCFASHASLWSLCEAKGEPTLILEDDALFSRRVTEGLFKTKYGALGINDPRGATRKANVYHILTQASDQRFLEVPTVDGREERFPMGLAGNSAYIIQPAFARMLLEKARDIGGMPNDSLMCKQWFPGQLGQTRLYHTRVQRTPSTLS